MENEDDTEEDEEKNSDYEKTGWGSSFQSLYAEVQHMKIHQQNENKNRKLFLIISPCIQQKLKHPHFLNVVPHAP